MRSVDGFAHGAVDVAVSARLLLWPSSSTTLRFTGERFRPGKGDDRKKAIITRGVIRREQGEDSVSLQG